MKKLIQVGLLSLFCSAASAQQPNSQIIEGKKLFHGSNCAGCHFKTENYDPLIETTNNFKEVRGWVKSCTQYFKIDWFPSEETAVTKYLNDIYYRYPIATEE